MISNSPNRNGGSVPHIITKTFPGFDVTWAGKSGKTGEFLLGSEDAQILITDENLEPKKGPTRTHLTYPEAINGIANVDDTIALSTRSEVGFATGSKHYPYPAGAHGVIATPSGYFVAPLGMAGVLILKPSTEENQTFSIHRSPEMPVYFYKVAHLLYRGGEVLACAARSGGVAAMPFLSNQIEYISSWTYPGLDVVDVCPLGNNLFKPAIAAIGRDNTLILFRDVLHERTPTAFQFDEINGIAYRLLNSNGNLLLLTSKALVVLKGLVQTFLGGQSFDLKHIPIKTIPLDGLDANIVDDQSLLIVGTN